MLHEHTTGDPPLDKLKPSASRYKIEQAVLHINKLAERYGRQIRMSEGGGVFRVGFRCDMDATRAS
jgi:hypothetical protein